MDELYFVEFNLCSNDFWLTFNASNNWEAAEMHRGTIGPPTISPRKHFLLISWQYYACNMEKTSCLTRLVCRKINFNQVEFFEPLPTHVQHF
jgi:hypothetical protein